ncbi:MAG TPA: hypothetical protein ENK31_00495, partial [Nannocystis exedens]|nr:hypothetical protein [Nannocystis exedens]
MIGDDAYDWVDKHPRLLRSLSWRDDDYSGHVLKFFQQFLGDGFEHLRDCVDFLDLRGWLEGNDLKLFAELYDGSLVVPAEEDLANLKEAAAIREALGRLRLLLEAGDDAGTIGTAKDLIESTAKVILSAENEPIGKTESLTSLIRRTHDVVDLHASTAAHSDPAVETAVRKIRGGLQAIAIGVADLRNAAGTG